MVFEMELLTERLILREFVDSDWQAVLAYQRDPLYLRYYPWTGRSPEDVRMFVSRFIIQQQTEPRTKFQLAVTLKSNGELVGNCGIRKDSTESNSADIGYEISPQRWGHGYATEAAKAILRFGFTQLNVHRVWATCIAENTASARVLEKLGMRLEGHLRENEHFKNRWWDTLIYAILAHEWSK